MGEGDEGGGGEERGREWVGEGERGVEDRETETSRLSWGLGKAEMTPTSGIHAGLRTGEVERVPLCILPYPTLKGRQDGVEDHG